MKIPALVSAAKRNALAVLFATCLAHSGIAQTKTTATAPLDNETIQLSVFTVKSDRDTGYVATNAISGTKLNTLIKDIPIAIQVVTQELIQDLQAVSIEEATRYVAGMSRASGAGESGWDDGRFNLRGFAGTSRKRNGFQSPALIDMTNIARVEILKGPSSVLYGESTASGIINYITKRPEAKMGSSLMLTAGSYDYYRAQLEATGPIGSFLGGKLLYRLDASFLDRSSNRTDNDLWQLFVSPQLLWNPFRHTNVIVSYERFKRDGQFSSKIPVYNTFSKAYWDALPTTSPNKTITYYNNPVRVNADGSYNSSSAIDRPFWNALADYLDWSINTSGVGNYNDAKVDNYDLVVEQQLGENLSARLSFNAYWQVTDALTAQQNRSRFGGDGMQRSPARHSFDSYRYTVQGDMSATQHFGKVDNRFLINFEFFRDERWRTSYGVDSVANSPTRGSTPSFFYLDTPYNFPTYVFNNVTTPLPLRFAGLIPVPVENIKTRTTNKTSAYAINDTLSFFEKRLNLLGGLRYQQSNQVLRSFDRYNVVTGLKVGSASESTPPREKATVPMVGISLQFNSWSNIYALKSESFVPQTGTALTITGETYKLLPVTGQSQEVGLKVGRPDGSFSATLAGFVIENKNRSRFGGLIPPGEPLAGQSWTLQTAAEESKGIELDGVWTPLKQWQILFGYAYTTSKIKDPAFAEAISPANPNSPVDTRIPGVPLHQVNLLQKYSFETGKLKGLAINFGLNYQGKRRGSESAQESYTLDGVVVYDAGISYVTKLLRRSSTLRLTVSNLFDKKYVNTGPFLADPRQIRFSIKTSF